MTHNHSPLLGAADLTHGLAGELRRLQNDLNAEVQETRRLTKALRIEEDVAEQRRRSQMRYKTQLDAHEREDAQAIELLRKARQTIGINADGARNLIDQAVTILNPPDDVPAPF